MDRAYTSGASATPPTAPSAPSIGYPQAGNPGAGTAATKPGSYWYHMITEELRAIITAAGLTPNHSSLVQVKAALDALYAPVTMLPQQAGEVCWFARATAPAGFIKANGAAVSRTAYAALFAAIGTTFGVGDGSTTFALPDLRGEFVRGWDDARGVDAARALGSAQPDLLKSHTHTVIATVTGAAMTPTSGVYNCLLATGQESYATGGAETRPRNVALLCCIKY